MKKFLIIFSLFSIILSFSAQAFAFGECWKFWNCSPSNNEYYTNYQQALSAVDKLVLAYSSKRVNSFMKLVSEDFIPDESMLETSIRNDFSKYSYIDINYVINNVVSDSKDKIIVSITFSRKLEEKATGNMVSDSGTTEITLKNENGNLKLNNMRSPYLFGVSNF